MCLLGASTPHALMACVPRLRILEENLRKLSICSDGGLCLDVLLSEVATTCPHLDEVGVTVCSERLGLLTDTGLVALAQLRKLKRVEVCGSEDVTKAGVMALALNWSVVVGGRRWSLNWSVVVEVCGSKDVTKAGVMALALNWSVDAIHMLWCSRFKWPDAKCVMNTVKRPYLDNKVT